MEEGSENNENQWSRIITDILDLVVACPHDNSNPPFCPLHKVRKLEAGERIKWALQLTDDEMDDITVNHQVCLKCRSSGT
jgi:hypothetical protein